MPSTASPSADAFSMIHTVREVSAKFGVTDGYIRRLCIENNLGLKKGRDRLLTDEDVESLRRILPNA
jgi:hypothetical protein